MAKKEVDLERLVSRLQLPAKEGFEVQEYVSLVNRRAKNLAEAMGEDYGLPARKMTILERTDELDRCADLTEFIDHIISRFFSPPTDLIFEVPEDLEASLYLVMSGHYRQAIALLRFACEIALLDRYFDLYKGYEEWKEGTFRVPSGIELISSVFPKEYAINKILHKHLQTLSSYVHVNRGAVTNQDLLITYNPEAFQNWYDLFVESCALIAQIFFAYYHFPRGTEPDWRLFETATGIDHNDLISDIWVKGRKNIKTKRERKTPKE